MAGSLALKSQTSSDTVGLSLETLFRWIITVPEAGDHSSPYNIAAFPGFFVQHSCSCPHCRSAVRRLWQNKMLNISLVFRLMRVCFCFLRVFPASHSLNLITTRHILHQSGTFMLPPFSRHSAAISAHFHIDCHRLLPMGFLDRGGEGLHPLHQHTIFLVHSIFRPLLSLLVCTHMLIWGEPSDWRALRAEGEKLQERAKRRREKLTRFSTETNMKRVQDRRH